MNFFTKWRLKRKMRKNYSYSGSTERGYLSGMMTNRIISGKPKAKGWIKTGRSFGKKAVYWRY